MIATRFTIRWLMGLILGAAVLLAAYRWTGSIQSVLSCASILGAGPLFVVLKARPQWAIPVMIGAYLLDAGLTAALVVPGYQKFNETALPLLISPTSVIVGLAGAAWFNHWHARPTVDRPLGLAVLVASLMVLPLFLTPLLVYFSFFA